jgi:DNA-binding transcriptional ArsR family regulator
MICFVTGRKSHESMSEAAVELVATRFRILGEPLRIRLIQALHDGEKSVSELVAEVGSTQPNVSKHLRILQEAGIVGRRQEGNLVYCFITDESVFQLCDAVCSSVGERLSRDAKLVTELNRGMTARRRG